jgi:hypothetical protein
LPGINFRAPKPEVKAESSSPPRGHMRSQSAKKLKQEPDVRIKTDLGTVKLK